MTAHQPEDKLLAAGGEVRGCQSTDWLEVVPVIRADFPLRKWIVCRGEVAERIGSRFVRQASQKVRSCGLYRDDTSALCSRRPRTAHW
jgi:hypothetical protein